MTKLRQTIHDLIYGRQHNRILRLSFPNNDAPSAQFVVNKIDALESVSRDFEYTIELLSDDASIPLKEMQGKLLSIELVRGDGTLRYFSGYVFSFRRCHSDGSITFYEAQLGPWLRFLSLRNDNYLFHGKTLREQAEVIFQDYSSYPRWEWRVASEDPAMTEACQFDESDFNYLSRRWEAAGWYYWYEHDAKGHTLVVSSDSTLAPDIDGNVEVRFQSEGGSLEEDAVAKWAPVREVMASSFAVSSFNFKDPVPCNVDVPTLNAQGNVPAIESYEYTGAYGFKNFQGGDAQSRIRMEEIEAVAKHIDAEGNNRFLMPGRAFRLIDHFNYNRRGTGNDEFFILSVRHHATNNYLQEAGETPGYRNWMTCTRKTVPWRPGRGFNSKDTLILAPQTATVVGPAGPDSIYTDKYGRVRVQFHWDRVGESDERSSTWLRVASSWAGAELGASAIPRVGTEVIVQWLNGCPDRPIITGALFNERKMPPWKLPAQQALSGFRSRELAPNGGNSAGGRSNHLIFDDTNQGIQVQLKSDHQCSQLSLGHITRIEDTAGRKDARGEGWELTTNAWGVARACKGMLITTEAIPNAKSPIKNMGETIQRLESAAKIQEQFATLAERFDAQEGGQQAAAAVDMKAQNAGIQGYGKGQFPELAEPHLVMASPAGIELSTSRSIHIASERHTALTTGKSLSIASIDGLFASIGNTFRLFVHKAGMRLIAAAGKISVQAQSDDVEIVANKVLELLSESDWVNIRGKKGVRLHGANNMLEIGEQVQFFTAAPVLFHGNLETLSAHARPQPSNSNAATRALTKAMRGRFDERFRCVAEDGETPLAHRRYRITTQDGESWEGFTNSQGLTERVYTNSEQALSLEIF